MISGSLIVALELIGALLFIRWLFYQSRSAERSAQDDLTQGRSDAQDKG